MKAKGFTHVSVSDRDMDESVRFYGETRKIGGPADAVLYMRPRGEGR